MCPYCDVKVHYSDVLTLLHKNNIEVALQTQKTPITDVKLSHISEIKVSSTDVSSSKLQIVDFAVAQTTGRK